ncbi:transposase [Desmonostoc muscorum LEGE 12446]|uniref:Transposase n=1 Tax=Desmonostoc muscorum LEGE 12446 TaxID=1828758 RepID=A0A8J6ZIT6_DESMC|nr:transposase [Desmonostoc muscorum]MCF2146535.1 transposase [Desmonostoc muscorum LEGE 12446]
MKYNPEKHHRRSIRLQGYDYSQVGAYFVTICTHQRECLFGAIADGIMELNQFGQMVADEWIRTLDIRPDFEFDEWIVMPNHLHGIVVIKQSAKPTVGAHDVGAHSCAPLPTGMLHRRPRLLSSFVAGFKSATTKRINLVRNTPGIKIWQRNYYDHVIRNESSLEKIREYVQVNPMLWMKDQLHPENPSKW